MLEPAPTAFHRSGTRSRSLPSVTATTLACPLVQRRPFLSRRAGEERETSGSRSSAATPMPHDRALGNGCCAPRLLAALRPSARRSRPGRVSTAVSRSSMAWVARDPWLVSDSESELDSAGSLGGLPGPAPVTGTRSILPLLSAMRRRLRAAAVSGRRGRGDRFLSQVYRDLACRTSSGQRRNLLKVLVTGIFRSRDRPQQTVSPLNSTTMIYLRPQQDSNLRTRLRRPIIPAVR